MAAVSHSLRVTYLDTQKITVH